LQDEHALMLTGFGTGLASIFDGVGDAGAPTNIERVVLRDGSSVVIRPLAVGDEAAIASWFAGLGAETRYARLFVLLARLDRRTQSGLARVDHFNQEAIAALAADGTKAGIARCLRTGERGSAEVAAAVADDWRGQGIARMPLGRIATRARGAGIQQFTAMCLATNNAVIRLLSRLGPTTVGPSDAGLVAVRIDLTGTRPDRSASGLAGGGRRD
jgi:GNAT superfamily N-acetyltransferase